MSKKANPAVIGSFVLGALVLTVTGIIILGGGSMFDEKVDCILYFDESISGLDIGAPVDFQGVRIGTVTEVWLEVDPEHDRAIYRPVKMQIEGRRIRYTGGRKEGVDPLAGLETLVAEQGLRARLASQSMLTGKLKVELGFFPDEPVVRKGRDKDIWEMPTIPSPFKQVANEVAELPLSEIVNEAHRFMKNLADVLDPEKTGNTIASLDRTLQRLDTILGKLDSRVDPMAEKSLDVLEAARASFRDLQKTLGVVNTHLEPFLKSVTITSESISQTLDSDSPARGEFALLINDLRDTAKSIRRLTDYLEQHPEAILQGKP